MATETPTTASHGAKAIDEFTPTMMSFYLLLRRFRKTIQTEIKYQAAGVDLFADEMADALRELEIAWEGLTETVFDVILHLPAAPEDRDLQRVAFLMKSVFEIEEPSDRAHLITEARKHRNLFSCVALAAQGEISARLIQRFFVLFDQMSDLKQFGGSVVEMPCPDFLDQIPA